MLWPRAIASPKAVEGAVGLSGGHEDWGAEGTEWGGIWGGVSPPQPTRKFGVASWAPPVRSRVKPRQETHFWHYLLVTEHFWQTEKCICCPCAWAADWKLALCWCRVKTGGSTQVSWGARPVFAMALLWPTLKITLAVSQSVLVRFWFDRW